MVEAARNSNVAVAGQNLHWEKEGAFTGEVSGPMLKEAGAEYVIIGHSERRRYFGETDKTVNQRLRGRAAPRSRSRSCASARRSRSARRNRTLDVLDRQMKDGLDGLTGEQAGGIVLAYEPVWAIGTGRNATPQQAGEAHAHIRSRVRQWLGADAADKCRILYGGSMKPDNVADLRAQDDVDGGLVGGASLDPRTFWQLVARGTGRAG